MELLADVHERSQLFLIFVGQCFDIELGTISDVLKYHIQLPAFLERQQILDRCRHQDSLRYLIYISERVFAEYSLISYSSIQKDDVLDVRFGIS